MKTKLLTLFLIITLSGFESLFAQHSVARQWNDVLLESIRGDFARPTVHARNLWHTSMAMYDAWAVIDGNAKTYLLGKTVQDFTCSFNGFPTPANPQLAQEEAISYAMYRILSHRFQNAPSAATLQAEFDFLMTSLGYSIANTGTNYASGDPAALGNYIAQCVIAYGLQDASNEVNDYANNFYAPVNDPLVLSFQGNPNLEFFNRWQPLAFSVFIDQSGNVIPGAIPDFLSPEWGQVSPFSLKEEDRDIYIKDGFPYMVYHDPGMPPQLDTMTTDESSEAYKWGFSLVAAWSSHLDPSDGVMWDISPASIGNITSYPTSFSDLPSFYNLEQGGDIGTGHAINPSTGMPYPAQMVARGDYARVLAEFWADGPDSETPPGHWFVILNQVNDDPNLVKNFKGTGPACTDLEWDIKTYFSLGGAMHDAAISAWGIKGYYDYIRPISAIRYMASLGQSSDPSEMSYHEGGLPLIPGFIEVVLPGDPLAGGTINVGKIKLKAWKGPGWISDPATDVAGVDWILADFWYPYQRPTFVTPPFAGYVSGHSTYSRAAAEVLTAITGDPFFPGGVGEFPVVMNDFLVFEDGPSTSFTLQWATYRDASDQCSLSRIWGGIHPPADDIPGRLIGETIGVEAFALAESYFYSDVDNDGFYAYEDCDDNNANVYPGAPEICDGLDNNCNGALNDGITIYTYYQDIDGDGFGDAMITVDTCSAMAPVGFAYNASDCNDNNANINSNAVEICDGLDNDCNGLIDDGITIYTYYADTDGDGYGNLASTLDTCLWTAPLGFVSNGNDCDDNNNLINPGITEVCDGMDNNCDGNMDEGLSLFTYYLDNDMDGFGDLNNSTSTCALSAPAGYVTNSNDCDDNNNLINPAIAEICDGIDNNCDGNMDEGLALFNYYPDVDMDGFGDPNTPLNTCATSAPSGYVLDNTDCDDTNPMANPNINETWDGVDNDCNGMIDDGLVGTENIAQMDVEIFPNPATNHLNISMDYQGTVIMKIMNAQGQLVNESTVLFNQNHQVQLTYPSGLYLIQASNDEGELLFVERFLKW